MPEFLLFRLYGPMASWGDIAVGEQRPTTPHPSKSAILGLAAAALGIRRHEDETHRELADGYGYAVRVDAPGVLLRDYHTTQVPESTARLRHLASRRDETRDPHNLYTVLSARDYRCDGLYTACLWRQGESVATLEALAEALRAPRLPLYLGRKSCPLALPLLPRCFQAETLEAAFAQYDAEQPDFFAERFKPLLGEAPDFYWEDCPWTQIPALHSTPRQDVPLSRRRWQFAKRTEHYGRGKP
jgi:CRISPR system Cascade subunit CasD